MARIRTIKPKFWDDSRLAKVSRDARLTFIAMWNFSDDLGVILAEPIWLKSKIYPFDQIQIHQFEKWLSELRESGFISLFSFKNEEFYYLPNFSKHQLINRPNFEDVNVKKDELQNIISSSLINHVTINDESHPYRKGKERKGVRDKFTPPVLDEVVEYFTQAGYSQQSAQKAFSYYDTAGWRDSKGNPVKNWKQKMIAVWFKDEHKSLPKDQSPEDKKKNHWQYQ